METMEHGLSTSRTPDRRAYIIERVTKAFFVYALTGVWDDSDEYVREFCDYATSYTGSRRHEEHTYWKGVWDDAEKEIAETIPNSAPGVLDHWQRLRLSAVHDPNPVRYITPNLMAQFSTGELRFLVRIAELQDRDFWFDGGGSITDAARRAKELAAAKSYEINEACGENLALLATDDDCLRSLSDEAVDEDAAAAVRELVAQSVEFANKRNRRISELQLEHMLLDARAKRLKHWRIFGQGLQEWSTCRDFLTRTLQYREI